MGVLAVLCLMAPGAWNLLETTTSKGAADPIPYLSGFAGLVLFFAYWSFRHGYSPPRQARYRE